MTTGFSPIFASNSDVTIAYEFILTLGFGVLAAEFNLARLDSIYFVSLIIARVLNNNTISLSSRIKNAINPCDVAFKLEHTFQTL